MSAIFPPVATDEFIRTAFERCPTGLLVVDGSGRIAVVNREVERQFGYTRDELLGQSVEMLVPGQFAAGHAKLRTQYAAFARGCGQGHARGFALSGLQAATWPQADARLLAHPAGLRLLT